VEGFGEESSNAEKIWILQEPESKKPRLSQQQRPNEFDLHPHMIYTELMDPKRWEKEPAENNHV
jgi:hypothetical protein